jgi:TonB family protein
MNLKILIGTFLLLSGCSTLHAADFLEGRGWTKEVDEFEGTKTYISQSAPFSRCVGLAMSVGGSVKGEISNNSVLAVSIFAATASAINLVSGASLRLRTKDGILDLPTKCSTAYERETFTLNCQAVALASDAKKMATTGFVRFETSGENFDMKPGNGCEAGLLKINQIGRDFYEATTGDLSLSADYELEQKEMSLAEEAERKRQAEEARIAEEQAATGAEKARKNEYKLIRTISPKYPRKAQTYGIEGYVVVGYTVTKEGNVTDPIILDGSSQGIFNQPAIEAVLQYKYKPRLVNGEPVDAPGARTTLTFEMAD